MHSFGNSNGNSLIKDEKTGFMKNGKNYSLTGFTPERKEQFFKELEETGHIGKALQRIGLSRQPFYTAMEHDPEFRRRYREAIMAMKWELEGTMYEKGKTPNGFLDRIAWLRRWFPSEYGQKTTIEHKTTENEIDSAFGNIIEVSASPSTADAPPKQLPQPIDPEAQ